MGGCWHVSSKEMCALQEVKDAGNRIRSLKWGSKGVPRAVGAGYSRLLLLRCFGFLSRNRNRHQPFTILKVKF